MSDGYYFGEIHEEKPHGLGQYINNNWEVYVGWFKNGERSGKGQFLILGKLYR